MLTLVGIVASPGFVVYDWLWRSRKIVVYRVQLDTPFSVIPDAPAFPDLRVGLEREGSTIADASMVLLRIANGGSQHIDDNGIRLPLCFVFEGRDIIGVEITETQPAVYRQLIQRAGGMRYEGGRLTLPHLPLNRGNHYKVLVLLTGTGHGITPEGHIRGGSLRTGAGHWQGPRFGVMMSGIVATLLLGC